VEWNLNDAMLIRDKPTAPSREKPEFPEQGQ